MRVLIADDDTVALRVLAAHLCARRHEVLTAANGEEAWEIFLRERPPLLFTDWMMPKPDGLALCRMIRGENQGPYTYIVMVTALSGRGSYLEGMRAGADDFVTKPVDPEELAARLRVAERILGLQTEVSQLRGLLPICAYCKKIRAYRRVWIPVDRYVAQRTGVDFSHVTCPECYEREVKPRVADLVSAPVAPRPG